MKKISLVITAAIMLCANNFADAQILTESFDGSTFPPVGWTNVRVSGAANPGTWQRLTAGTNPTCLPHSGAGMGYYNGYSWSGGNAGDLSTPVLDFSSGSFAVSFWMYRDSGQLAKYDSVSVYVDVNTSSAGGTRLGVINRSKNLSPAVASEGWYQYTFNIPGSFNTATNYVIFKGTSDFGNRMYIDDISVYSLTPPNDLAGISASDSAICNGSSTKLYASGIDGTVYWYTASCGGTLLGTGDSISVNPSQTTTYYARNFKNNIYSTNCSSISITVNSGYTIAVSDTICAHSNYTLADGTIVDTAGIYTVTVPTINGCDSTVTVTLALRPEITEAISQTICFGDSLLFNGSYYSQNGSYSDTLTAINGCNSIVTLTLTVRPEIVSSFSQTICFGDSLLFNGSYYSQNGNYKDTLVAVSGCDSIVTLNLFVRPQITSTLGQSICNGDSLLYNGSYYYQQGNYADTLTSVDGCDSIIILVLTVNIADTPVIVQNGLVLSTQSANAYEWLKDGVAISGANNQTYTATENGAYSVQTVDANGCSATSNSVNITGVGIAENSYKAITVFPNPATDFLMLNNLPVNKKTEVQIFSVTGQLILKEQVTHNLLRIDLLPSGVYTLLIVSPDNYQRHIFVKK